MEYDSVLLYSYTIIKKWIGNFKQRDFFGSSFKKRLAPGLGSLWIVWIKLLSFSSGPT